MKKSLLLIMVVLLVSIGCSRNSASDNIKGDKVMSGNVLEEKDFLELVKEDVAGDEKSIYWDGTKAALKEDFLDSYEMEDGRYGEQASLQVTVPNAFELYYLDDMQDLQMISETAENYHMKAKNMNIYVCQTDYETEKKLLEENINCMSIDKTQLSENNTKYFDDYELYVGKEETDEGVYVGYVLLLKSALGEKNTYKISVTGMGALEEIKKHAFYIMNHFTVLFY